jgi:hypothetical protein
MEIVKDINLWLLNPGHRLPGSVECRSLRWHKVFEPCLSKSGQSLRRFSSPDVRLRLPMYCVRRFRGFRNGKVLIALPAGRFRCLEGSDDRLSEQKPYRGIDRNRKKFLFDGYPSICERICRIVFWEENPSVARKQSDLYALANPLSEKTKVFWPKFMGKLKSIPIIFSHNLLYLFMLQQFSQKLMGQ